MTSPQSKALALSIFTVAYNAVEGIVSVLAAAISGSSALLGFGLDSFVESLSGCIMVWRFWKYGPEADVELIEAAESKATRLVAYSFFVLGAYVTFDAGSALYMRKRPEATLIGILVAIASIIVMPIVFWIKYRLGKSIGSRSLVADSKQTLACMQLSVALLLGLAVHFKWGIWWADHAAALVIAVLIFREGYETLKAGSGEAETVIN